MENKTRINFPKSVYIIGRLYVRIIQYIFFVCASWSLSNKPKLGYHVMILMMMQWDDQHGVKCTTLWQVLLLYAPRETPNQKFFLFLTILLLCCWLDNVYRQQSKQRIFRVCECGCIIVVVLAFHLQLNK